jgi:hypothetical protein
MVSLMFFDWSLSLAHRILGLSLSSQAFMRQPWEATESPPAYIPWYAARSPCEPRRPEERRQARLVRRLIRRHWFALLFDVNSPGALAVREAMKEPESTEREDIYAQIRRLLDAEKMEIRPEVAAEWAKEFGVQTKIDLDASIGD